jgi:sulfate adenylyltransferase
VSTWAEFEDYEGCERQKRLFPFLFPLVLDLQSANLPRLSKYKGADCMSLITPHGGKLVNRVLTGAAAESVGHEAVSLTAITLSPREQFDLEMIAIGAFSPLTGFMGRADFDSVCKKMRLADGTVWPIPVTLCPAAEDAAKINLEQRVALKDAKGRLLGILHVREKFHHDKELEIPNVYRTTDDAHAGVALVRKQSDICLGGTVDVINPNYEPEFPEYRLTPAQTREAFSKHGWNTVAAFQTRNPIHRSHEYLTKCALEMTDGLLIHPLVGETKSHALIRKNYGCTHFIVGRDHAGVGNYYGTYDAQKIFDEFDLPREIGVTILKFEHTAWCKACAAVVSPKTCPHGQDQKVAPSGTKVREMLRAGQRPPNEFSRPEIADILIKWAQSVG